MLPGWHSTIFPPYFVAGAIFSGFAMVVTLMVPARAYLGLKHLVTLRHLDNMNKIILATGCIVAYSYAIEVFVAWYGGNAFEQFAAMNRALGPMLGLLGPDLLQRGGAAGLLVQALPHDAMDDAGGGGVGEHRHVARTLRHHRGFLESRFSAQQLGHVLSDLGRSLRCWRAVSGCS